MRAALYDMKAAKQTVSLTINSDLYAKAKNFGINASQVAEEALTQTLARRLADQVKAEIRQDLDAYNAYVAEHGSPAELARTHYAERE
jgi:post-segregation antitoxin (ccd killing protein)